MTPRIVPRLGRLLLRIAVIAVAVCGAALASLFAFFPRAAQPEQGVFEPTPERLARGRYLVEHVTDCLDCHSERDWSRYSGPIMEDTKGQGAKLVHLGSATRSANITPYGIGYWTDGDIARAIASGVSRDGRALSPMMPYDVYASLSREDLQSIVVHLRTFQPIRRDSPPAGDPLLVTLLGRMLPSPADPQAGPDPSDSVAYGRYLVTIAECGYCHRADFSGGVAFRPLGGPPVSSANITPRPKGLGMMTREGFIGAFKSFAAPEVRETPVPPGGRNTVMPWIRYSGMTEADLGAIFDFLRSMPPIEPKPAAAAK